MAPLIDTHAHLSMLGKRGIRVRELLDSLFASGFGGIMDVGTEADDLAPRVEEFGAYPDIRFTAGIWPSEEAISNAESRMASLEESIEKVGPERIAAIGECGLDRHWNREESGADIEGERELLRMHARLALRLEKPIVIHSREAAEETVRTLGEFAGLSGVIHCFSYGVEEVRKFLDLGFHISFSGTVTYKNADSLREAARYVPADRLLAETDSPYLAPIPFRGKSADPSMVERTYEALSAARGEPMETLSACAAENAARLFGFGAIATRP